MVLFKVASLQTVVASIDACHVKGTKQRLRRVTSQQGVSANNGNVQTNNLFRIKFIRPRPEQCAHPHPQTQPRTFNIVLFGETGVGKSSVINLIAQKDITTVSSDVNGCTMHSTRYPISFDDTDFAIFDTIGLDQPQLSVNGYLKAIEKAYELIGKLRTAGGIHLLLFCMRGGRMTTTTQSNYRLFCNCLCGGRVPVALVFTGLEKEVTMEDWWTRNKGHIEKYGIRSTGHACVTAVQDNTPEECQKYAESKTIIRQLIKDCACRSAHFSPESLPWFADFAHEMREFIPGKTSLKRRDILKLLRNHCRLDADTAKKIAAMMDTGFPGANTERGHASGNQT